MGSFDPQISQIDTDYSELDWGLFFGEMEQAVVHGVGDPEAAFGIVAGAVRAVELGFE